MRKKAISEDQGPLRWFLGQMFDANESRLAFLAHKTATKTFDAMVFRTELITKLKRLYYPQPDPERGEGKKTFHEILEDAGVIEVLLHEEVLRGLWQRRLLKDLFERDDDLRKKNMSMEGVPISEHWKKVRKIQKDMKILEKLAKEYRMETSMAECYEKVAGECVKAWRPIMTTRYPDSKAEVILSHPSEELSSSVKSEGTAVQAIIYLWLKNKLQTKSNRRRGISDIFLCQLSELIWANPAVRSLSDGETIRRMASRLSK